METLPSIQQSLTQFLGLLGNLSKGQLEGICHFVNAKTVPGVILSPQWLAPWVNELSPERIDKLIEKAGTAYQLNDVPYPPENVEASPEEKEEAMFVQLYHLWLLHKLLNELNDLQLMRWFEAIPVSPQIQQLQLLQEIHQLMAQLNVDTIVSLHQELQTNEEEPLNNLLQLEPKDFYLYKPLRMLFTLPLEELLELKRVMPQWDFLQLLHLTKLAQLGLQEATNIRILLSPKVDDPRNRPMEERIPLTLEIVEQPPGKCVYKRNVKPPPSVMVNGDQRFNDGNIYVVPILLRCDTLEELPKLIKGDAPVKITSSNTIIFKRLKILSTSHQLNEALFSLRFDLRCYNPNNPNEYETIHTVTTTPICVLSHSSQLKATSKNLPVVLEVLPFCGPPSGNTRVAILGNNFIDSPTTRVKFDNTEVMPFFHGTKTLICHVPRHSPGPVIVRVCNDYNRWSETAGTFTYLAEPTNEQQTENIPVPTAPNFPTSLNNSGGLTNLINQTLGNDTFYGDLLNMSSLDTQSYSSLQMVNN